MIYDLIIYDGINSFMQSTMVLSIHSLILSFLMYRGMRLCEIWKVDNKVVFLTMAGITTWQGRLR